MRIFKIVYLYYKWIIRVPASKGTRDFFLSASESRKNNGFKIANYLLHDDLNKSLPFKLRDMRENNNQMRINEN